LHEFEKQQKSHYELWYHNSKTIVFLSVESIAELEKLRENLLGNKIPFAGFREPDLNNQLTSLCIISTNKTKQLCKNLPLALSEFSLKERGAHV